MCKSQMHQRLMALLPLLLLKGCRETEGVVVVVVLMVLMMLMMGIEAVVAFTVEGWRGGHFAEPCMFTEQHGGEGLTNLVGAGPRELYLLPGGVENV